MERGSVSAEPFNVEQLNAELVCLRKQVGELTDRQAIRDCLARYSRGVDRMDKELILSAYHPDAVDDHCFLVAGPQEFAEWSNALHEHGMYSHQHVLTTHNCELDGDVAHVETYWMVAAMNKVGAKLTLSGGRYIDRFEKRQGEWKIAERKLVYDWIGAPGERQFTLAAKSAIENHAQGSRDRSDPSYQRPLTVLPGRIGFKVPF